MLICAMILIAGVIGMQAVGHAEVVLEPFTYSEDFETRELSAWASYPMWQDTAYDPNMRVNEIIPGDPNISVVQIVTPYTNVDNYTGAIKELDMYLAPGSKISLRYYLKTNLPAAFFKLRLACGPDGKIDVTIADAPTNRWEKVNVSYNDFIRENPWLAGKNKIKVNAMAVLAKIPDADPAMPIYLGLDDIVFQGQRAMAFQFAEPKMFKLSEWKPYISQKHYKKGDTLKLSGDWPLDADKVTLDMALYTDRAKKVLSTSLGKIGGSWALKPVKLSYTEGLYLGTLTAYRGKEEISATEFTIFIVPDGIGGNHPRIWYDDGNRAGIEARFDSDRFASVRDGIMKSSKSSRESLPIDGIVFDIDQFPDEKWLIGDGSQEWFSKISTWRSTIHSNALAYSLGKDREAGHYCKDLLVKISKFPYWLNPWMRKRGRNIYYPVGELGMEIALGYDLVYELMSEDERKIVRAAMMKNIVLGAHKGYVEDDLVTSNTSNWVAHITGGSLMCQAAMYGDGSDVEQMEPYLTGAILKDHQLIQYTLDREGAYGEGYGYFNFSMLSWSKSLPVVENVFNVDMSSTLNKSYHELIWAGIVKEKQYYYFGDSSGGLRPKTNFAWLLPKYQDPLLGWFYNFMKGGETFMDVLYETDDVPRDDPFDEEPVGLWRDVGTTVFKSGWEPDDFVFVFRSGPFVNHQHADQGTFWLSDRGSLFIEERHGSTYYIDPLYQPWYTQPVAHSTILIDGNHQSQRIGDLLWHVDGLDDYAFVGHFLNGTDAAFVQGDIGRLYWGKVKSMQRNVLYLKPRTLLMLDTITPAERDVDVTLLYQTHHLDDITASDDQSSIEKDGNTLHISHLSPDYLDVEKVETPHYIYTLRRQKPLEKEGMLTVTARTDGNPLVMANILTSTTGPSPAISVDYGDGCVSGTVEGVQFTYSTRPGTVYEKDGVVTDALAVTNSGGNIFAALCTTFSHNGRLFFEAANPVTFEMTHGNVKYYACSDTRASLSAGKRPSSVTVNGKAAKDFDYDPVKAVVTITLLKGEGVVIMK
ncbi:heparinase II/III family protein [Candidatus Latescibacterota bacterium]